MTRDNPLDPFFQDILEEPESVQEERSTDEASQENSEEQRSSSSDFSDDDLPDYPPSDSSEDDLPLESAPPLFPPGHELATEILKRNKRREKRMTLQAVEEARDFEHVPSPLGPGRKYPIFGLDDDKEVPNSVAKDPDFEDRREPRSK